MLLVWRIDLHLGFDRNSDCQIQTRQLRRAAARAQREFKRLTYIVVYRRTVVHVEKQLREQQATIDSLETKVTAAEREVQRLKQIVERNRLLNLVFY